MAAAAATAQRGWPALNYDYCRLSINSHSHIALRFGLLGRKRELATSWRLLFEFGRLTARQNLEEALLWIRATSWL